MTTSSKIPAALLLLASFGLMQKQSVVPTLDGEFAADQTVMACPDCDQPPPETPQPEVPKGPELPEMPKGPQ